MAADTRVRRDGIKRRRRTRRELPYGTVSLWARTTGNFKREREARIAELRFADQLTGVTA